MHNILVQMLQTADQLGQGVLGQLAVLHLRLKGQQFAVEVLHLCQESGLFLLHLGQFLTQFLEMTGGGICRGALHPGLNLGFQSLQLVENRRVIDRLR
jgi:hypothetical protein